MTPEWVKRDTEPTEAEVARLRPPKRQTRARWAPAGLLFVSGLAMAWAGKEVVEWRASTPVTAVQAPIAPSDLSKHHPAPAPAPAPAPESEPPSTAPGDVIPSSDVSPLPSEEPDADDVAAPLAARPARTSVEVTRGAAPVPVPAVAPVARDPVAPDPPPAAAATAAPSSVDAASADYRALLDEVDAGAPATVIASDAAAFVRAHGTSPYADEADVLRVTSEASVVAPKDGLALLEGWLAAHPASGRAVEVHAAAARVARDGLHDCAAALPHDRWVAENATGSRKDAAKAWEIRCEAALGFSQGPAGGSRR